nr:PREDICTED: uncharacterized protein LOC105675302 isoform X2 [Linepithema humile]
MGKRKLNLSTRRLSLKKGHRLRRRMLREMQKKLANNTQATLTTENPTDSIESQVSAHLLPDNITDADVNTEIHCFGQIKEEKSVDNEEFETYEENGVYNLNIKHFEDNKDEDDTITIEKSSCLLDAMCMQENIPEGRCIVDISFVWNELRRVFDNHMDHSVFIGIKCQFKDWKLVKFYRRGLRIQFSFKCQMCRQEASIWSEHVESETLDINASVVAATLKAGIGFSQLKKLCAAMNIVCMSNNTYRKNKKNLLENYNKTAIQNIKRKLF